MQQRTSTLCPWFVCLGCGVIAGRILWGMEVGLVFEHSRLTAYMNPDPPELVRDVQIAWAIMWSWSNTIVEIAASLNCFNMAS